MSINSQYLPSSFLTSNWENQNSAQISFFPNSSVKISLYSLTDSKSSSQLSLHSSPLGLDFYFNKRNPTSSSGLLIFVLYSPSFVSLFYLENSTNLPDFFKNFFTNHNFFGVLSYLKVQLITEIIGVSFQYIDLVDKLKTKSISLDLPKAIEKLFKFNPFNENQIIPPPDSCYGIPFHGNNLISIAFPIIGWATISQFLDNPPESPVNNHVETKFSNDNISSPIKDKAVKSIGKKPANQFYFKPTENVEKEITKVDEVVEKEIKKVNEIIESGVKKESHQPQTQQPVPVQTQQAISRNVSSNKFVYRPTYD